MATGYASRLKKGVDYGTCGLPESFDSPRVYQVKITKLIQAIKESKYLCVHTGAGISTACGIPDFRGPRGVWTLEKQKEKETKQKGKKETKKRKVSKKVPEDDKQQDDSFENAQPSLTHMALLGLERAGKLKFIVTQNVDSLHIKSGFPIEKMAELHGNVFKESCEDCGKTIVRSFDVKGIGLRRTGRICECGGHLRDCLLDWDDALPEVEFKKGEKHSSKADLIICLGTSLRVRPANELPLLPLSNGGKLVIVNLQQTPLDETATIKLHSKCDEVLKEVMAQLKIPIPVYRHSETFLITTTRGSLTSDSEYESSSDSEPSKLSWLFSIQSADKYRKTTPFIERVEIKGSLGEYTIRRQPVEKPLSWKQSTPPSSDLEIDVCIYFAKRCTLRKFETKHVIKVGEKESQNSHTVETVKIDYNEHVQSQVNSPKSVFLQLEDTRQPRKKPKKEIKEESNEEGSDSNGDNNEESTLNVKNEDSDKE